MDYKPILKKKKKKKLMSENYVTLQADPQLKWRTVWHRVQRYCSILFCLRMRRFPELKLLAYLWESVSA